MSIAPTIPITQVKANLSDSVRLAVGEIERFLGMFYPSEAIEQTKAAQAIAGQWLSRVKGFQRDDDFWFLTRDFLAYTLTGGERSLISDQLAYYFSGFMPSYGAACTLLDMVADGCVWSEVQAFMHTLSYGNAREYVEGFDWAGGEKKAQAEVDAWIAILEQQDQALHSATYGEPVLLAHANPQFLPQADPPPLPQADPPLFNPQPLPKTDVPAANDPNFPKTGSASAVVRGILSRLLGSLLGIKKPILFLLTPQELNQDENEGLARRDAEYEARKERREQNKLVIQVIEAATEAASDTTNNECMPQTEENKKKGEICERAGYAVMENVLRYKRLVDPPRGRGLDGLFEKLPSFNAPYPMPDTVMLPPPGRLLFIPQEAEPPQERYDYAAIELDKPAASIYPKFVVFEAKNISKSFDPDDTEGMAKEAKRRLGNTCDGTQLGVRWTKERIPQALERQYPGAKNRTFRDGKREEIEDTGYARWIFVCLPGPIGSEPKSKLFVLIDVVEKGMDLESRAPKQRQGPSSTPTTY